MALVAVDPFPLPTVNGWDTAYTSQLIDAAGEKSAVVFYAPTTGEIDRVCFRTATVTTGDTVDVRLETVGTDGLPTGTLADTNSNASQVIADANDNVWFEVTLTASATVTKGTPYAIVIVNGSGGGNMNIACMNPQSGGYNYTPAHTGLYTTSWSMSSGRHGVGAVRYDSTTYPHVPGMYPVSSIDSTTNINTGTTPDEIGNRFVCPVDCKVAGIWAVITTWIPGDNYSLVLYDTDGTNVLGTAAIAYGLNATNPVKWGQFATEATLAAGGTYRAVIKPTTANSIRAIDFTLDASAKASMQGYSSWGMYKTSRTDAGAWSDATGNQVAVGLMISALDDGAGGASTAASYGFVG